MSCSRWLISNRKLSVVLLATAVLSVALSTQVFAQPIATYNLSSGWATFGISVPQGLAHEALSR
jgi:hypothetical protein